MTDELGMLSWCSISNEKPIPFDEKPTQWKMRKVIKCVLTGGERCILCTNVLVIFIGVFGTDRAMWRKEHSHHLAARPIEAQGIHRLHSA